ncbi:MAG: response regulator [Polaromonas sp.]|uniref:sensor histidine kinase n=1 Tax=Polaromonas sp. TaxID=1869339 RepID=UPI0027309FAD|nr:response regulator [Polaromonas sp.]MDP2452132.1 response regulator [Polaromonas sp.]MDP3246084.1 response regulator [Polaromonas sp.]MDP3756354.1 response regulator [Polaromonas sp.]
MTDPAATILIVDDEVHNRKLLEILLEHEGYLTRTAASGEEALASIAQQAPDLVLLDVMMPGIDGYEVASMLKINPDTSHIPVIIVTALIDRSARLAGLDAGAEEFLTKPVDRTELGLRVRNLLRLKALGDFLQDHSRILEAQIKDRVADLLRFRVAMDATADAIFLTNRDTMDFAEVNATASKMLGYTREELFQLGPLPLREATLEQLESTYDAIIAGHGASELQETLLRRKDGSEVPVEAHQQAQRSGADWIIVSVMRDITERKQAQQEILRLNAELEARVQQRTAQLQAANYELETFSYSVSHDLRTPLSAINGYSNLLDKEIDKSAMGDRGKHYLTRIRAGVVQMGELIDALLSLAHVSRTDLRWDHVDLSSMAEAVLGAYRERAPDRLAQIDIAPKMVVQGDPRLLRQVLDNLLGNAWKFSDQQPQTRITLGRENGPDGQPIYIVRDNGAGFDMAYSEKLFGAFQRLHTASEFPGHGIGLATVHRIVTRHGGRIWAESVPGNGATFYFTLGRPHS